MEPLNTLTDADREAIADQIDKLEAVAANLRGITHPEGEAPRRGDEFRTINGAATDADNLSLRLRGLLASSGHVVQLG